MTNYFLTSLLIISCFLASAQTPRSADWCGTDYFLEKQYAQNPALRAEHQQQREKFRQLLEQFPAVEKSSGAVKIIPVVVHVLHDNGKGNISQAQVQDGIKVLTRDYRRLNADTNNTRAIFKPYAADSEVEFRLAQKDPNGNCTNGIVRKSTPLTYNADDNAKSTSLGGSSAWPTNKYFNIWLVNSIESSGGGTTLGYAQFPGWGSWNTYGLIMLHTEFGTIGTSFSEGRTTSHEAGHCFNLYHTFQGGCGSNCSGSGDDVCDTPPVLQNTWSCNKSQNSCNNDSTGGGTPFTSNQPDQIENYMSYDACQNMFSLGQKTRMVSALTTISQLINLTSAANLVATGTDGSSSLCAADFQSDRTILCAGEPVTFSDESYNGPTSWQWTFNGGTPASSTQQNPVVTYTQPGKYDIALSVGNGTSSVSATKTAFITVLAVPGGPLPYSEGFETPLLIGNNWFVINPDNLNTWEQVNTVGFSGTSSIKMNNFGNTTGNKDELLGPTIDLSGISGAAIRFKYAFAQKVSTNTDKFTVYASGDCGKTWSVRWSATGAPLATVTPQTTTFTPSSPTQQWVEKTVAINFGSFLKSNFRIKFAFESGGGNNLYIDNINIISIKGQVPLLVSPLDGTGGHPNNVKLDWNAVPSAVASYNYQLDTAGSFNSPLLLSGDKAFINSSVSTDTDTEFQTGSLLFNRKYYWRVRTITSVDTSSWSSVWEFITAFPDGTNEVSKNIPLSLKIFPHPMKNNSTLHFYLPSEDHLRIEIYDLLGKKVAAIADRKFSAGDNQMNISKGRLDKGVYLIQLTTGSSVAVERLVIAD